MGHFQFKGCVLNFPMCRGRGGVRGRLPLHESLTAQQRTSTLLGAMKPWSRRSSVGLGVPRALPAITGTGEHRADGLCHD